MLDEWLIGREQSHINVFACLIAILDGDVMGVRSFFQPVLLNRFSLVISSFDKLTKTSCAVMSFLPGFHSNDVYPHLKALSWPFRRPVQAIC